MSTYRRFWACLLLSSLLFFTIVLGLKALPQLELPAYARAGEIAIVGLALLAFAQKEEGAWQVLAGAGALALVYVVASRADAYTATAVLSVGFASSLFYYYARTGKDFTGTLRELGITRKRFVGEALYGVFLTLAIYGCLLLMFAIYSRLGIADSEKVVQVIEGVPLSVLLLAVFISPITEELFFRGLLAPRIGILGSSIIFAISHVTYGSVMEILNVFIVGLIFAWVFLSRRSLISPMVSHAIINATAVYLTRFAL
ncbi:CAAX protease self-immunity [Candidatus Burarchaeum australiense]|nr:CAAX protease self-immunity [Candidatus Burarchaeum australiense]